MTDRDESPTARTLRFPTDRPLGMLFVRTEPLEHELDRAWEELGYEWGRSDWIELAEARGDVAVPGGASVLLQVATDRTGRGATERLDLSPLDGLPADALAVLDLEALPPYNPEARRLEEHLDHVAHLVGLWWLRILPEMWTDQMLAHVAGLVNLRLLDLTLARQSVTDAGLAHLARLAELRYLDLEKVGGVTDAGLAHLAGLPEMRRLNLHGTGVSGPGLMHLAEMRSLQSLALECTTLTDAGLAHLPHLAALEDLDIGTTEVTDAGLAHLAGFPSLRSLCLEDLQITDAAVRHLADLPSLEMVRLVNTRVTDDGVRRLLETRPGLDVRL